MGANFQRRHPNDLGQTTLSKSLPATSGGFAKITSLYYIKHRTKREVSANSICAVVVVTVVLSQILHLLHCHATQRNVHFFQPCSIASYTCAQHLNHAIRCSSTQVLVEFLSIGTLMSFTMVAASVIILRYQPASSCQFKLKDPEGEGSEPTDPPPDASDKQSILKSQVGCVLGYNFVSVLVKWKRRRKCQMCAIPIPMQARNTKNTILDPPFVPSDQKKKPNTYTSGFCCCSIQVPGRQSMGSSTQ